MNQWTFLCIHELDDVETLRLCEPTHVVFGNEELVLALRRRDQRAKEIDLVLADEPADLEGVLALLALLCSCLSFVDCSLSSSLTPGTQLLLSCNCLRLVFLAGELLLFCEILFALLEAVGGFLALLLDFFDEDLLLVLELFVPGFEGGLCFSMLTILCLLLSRLGRLGNVLFLLGKGLTLCPESSLLLL